MGRPTKYDWEDKRDICYKLHVEQKLTVSQIIQHFAEHFNVPTSELPGVNQFYAHFRRWGFPSRRHHLSEDEKARVLERTRELFNQNYTAQDALQKLQDEGYAVDRYRFRVLRKKHDMILRSNPGFRKRGAAAVADNEPGEGNVEPEGGAMEVEREPEMQSENEGEDANEPAPAKQPSLPTVPNQHPPLPQEELTRRAQRTAELQAQSEQRLQSRKRRRRIRGWGHLPPDDPNLEPRYGSETSLDECKAFLHLDNEEYTNIRERYLAICEEMGIIKMTLCAPGEWQASKDRLVRDSPHLSAVLHPLQPDQDKKLNALNCICSDVTKRMRNATRFMSIADANNALGLDPNESKDVRRIFYELLGADHFTGMIMTGKDRIDELRAKWYSLCPVLEAAVTENDPRKLKAIHILDRDTRKRFLDDQARIDPSRRKQWQKEHPYGPGPGPAPIRAIKGKRRKPKAQDQTGPTPASSASALTNKPSAWPPTSTDTTINFELDPLLGSAMRAPVWPPGDAIEPPRMIAASEDPSPTTITVYFRLATGSSLQHHPNHPALWLGRLPTPTIAALHLAATSKAPGAVVNRVQGIASNSLGGEDAWIIDGEDELLAYLAEAGEKPTFAVNLGDMPL